VFALVLAINSAVAGFVVGSVHQSNAKVKVLISHNFIAPEVRANMPAAIG